MVLISAGWLIYAEKKTLAAGILQKLAKIISSDQSFSCFGKTLIPHLWAKFGALSSHWQYADCAHELLANETVD